MSYPGFAVGRKPVIRVVDGIAPSMPHIPVCWPGHSPLLVTSISWGRCTDGADAVRRQIRRVAKGAEDEAPFSLQPFPELCANEHRSFFVGVFESPCCHTARVEPPSK